MVIATCGHTLTEKENMGTTIYVKEYSNDGTKAISYKTLCDKCVKMYRKNKLELKTQQERDNWFNC